MRRGVNRGRVRLRGVSCLRMLLTGTDACEGHFLACSAGNNDQWPLVLPSKTPPPAEKQVSIAKAISVKEDHLVKYPDYKFTPAPRKKGRGRYIVNRNRDIIDEARRATPIGKGAEGMELGRALEVEAKICAGIHRRQ